MVSGKTLAAIQGRQDQLWAGDNIQRGPGIYRRGSGTGGFSLAARGGGQQVPQSPSTPNSFPFQITYRQTPFTPPAVWDGTYQMMVNPDSTVMLSGKPNDNLSVTGLGVWRPFIANDVIALYIVVSGYAATTATIQSYGLGTTTFDPTLAAWAAGQNSYVFNDLGTPPLQIGINILLGYSTPTMTGAPFFVQAQFDHVLLENSDIDGQPAIFDFSHRERYGITAP